MSRIRLLILLAITQLGLLGCGGDPAAPSAPPAPPDPPPPAGPDLAAILADHATGAVDGYAAALHAEFRFLPPEAGAFAYDHAQEIDLLAAMHAGEAGTGGEVLQALEVVALEPLGDWTATGRDDPLGAHRATAVKRSYAVALRFTLAAPPVAWEVAGTVLAFGERVDDQWRLLGLVDRTGTDPGERSWSEVRRAWAEAEAPDLPGAPDLLSMRWITAHDGRDWLRLGELLHPDFRYVTPAGELRDRADELATFADLMAGRAGRDELVIAQLDVQDWEKTEFAWNPVGADDPLFGDVPDAVAEWIDVRIVYTTGDAAEWVVSGLVRMVAVESERGYQLLGFVDDSTGTGEPGSVGWELVRGWYR